MHAINAYNTLQQGPDEPTEAYLHRAQDILEHIHYTNNMSEITAIGTNHAKILNSLKDKRSHSKLAVQGQEMEQHGTGSTGCCWDVHQF